MVYLREWHGNNYRGDATVTAVKPAGTGNGSENGGNGDHNHGNAAVMGFKVDSRPFRSSALSFPGAKRP